MNPVPSTENETFLGAIGQEYRKAWDALNPVGRVLFFVPAVVLMTALFAGLVIILLPPLWISEGPVGQWCHSHIGSRIEKAFRRMFCNPTSNP